MIGVAAVIMVITLVNGANKFVATKVYGYGADVFTASKQPSVIFQRCRIQQIPEAQRHLKLDDYREVAAKCAQIAPPREPWPAPPARWSTTATPAPMTRTFAVGPGTMPPIYNINIDRGRGFVPVDEEHNSRVAHHRPRYRRQPDGSRSIPSAKKFASMEPSTPSIGVGERKGKTLGQSQDDWVAVPHHHVSQHLRIQSQPDHLRACQRSGRPAGVSRR